MITVYTQPNCQPCRATVRVLKRKGYTIDLVDVSQDEEAGRFVRSLGYKKTPVVVLEDGTSWCDHQAERLDELPNIND